MKKDGKRNFVTWDAEVEVGLDSRISIILDIEIINSDEARGDTKPGIEWCKDMDGLVYYTN